jgi:formylglycine-generating enzyme required for sulfatase activity
MIFPIMTSENKRIALRYSSRALWVVGVLVGALGLLWWFEATAGALGASFSQVGTMPPLLTATPSAKSAQEVQMISSSFTVSLPLIHAQFPRFLPLIFDGPPANMPTEPHPPHQSVNQSPNSYLSWQIKDSDKSTLRYEVYLDPNNPDPQTLIFQGYLPKMAFDPETFIPGTEYFWRVVTLTDNNRRTVGPVWSFHTEGLVENPDLDAMIAIPAGEFLMGCDPARNPAGGCQAKDSPLHTVYLDSYAIDKYEVTNQEYRECVTAGACPAPRRTDSNRRRHYYNNPEYNLFPVLYVSWWDARDYCAWEGKRLPTEAEWEKAARGPIDTRTWPWGEEYPDCTRLNFIDDSDHPNWIMCVRDTSRVGSYPTGASPYGVMDMSGNVFEWVYDVFDDHYNLNYYSVSPYANPTGPELSRAFKDQPYFVIRGGSYRPRWYYPRVFHRHHGHHGDCVDCDKPFFRNNQVGFRCAVSIED